MRSPLHRRRARRGAYAVESIVVLVVLILATFVSFQFGIALLVKQAVAQAATVAAREAAKQNPAGPDELEQVIERVLGGHRITLGPQASFVLENPSPVTNNGELPTRGTLACPISTLPQLDNEEIRVTVCVSLTTHPILNILSGYGIDFTGRTFEISAVAMRE